LDDVEDCKAKVDIVRFQLKAKVEKEILRKDAEVQTELYQGPLALLSRYRAERKLEMN